MRPISKSTYTQNTTNTNYSSDPSNIISGVNNQVYGKNNVVSGNNNVVKGDNNTLSASSNVTVAGNSNKLSTSSNVSVAGDSNNLANVVNSSLNGNDKQYSNVTSIDLTDKADADGNVFTDGTRIIETTSLTKSTIHTDAGKSKILLLESNQAGDFRPYNKTLKTEARPRFITDTMTYPTGTCPMCTDYTFYLSEDFSSITTVGAGSNLEIVARPILTIGLAIPKYEIATALIDYRAIIEIDGNLFYQRTKTEETIYMALNNPYPIDFKYAPQFTHTDLVGASHGLDVIVFNTFGVYNELALFSTFYNYTGSPVDVRLKYQAEIKMNYTSNLTVSGNDYINPDIWAG